MIESERITIKRVGYFRPVVRELRQFGRSESMPSLYLWACVIVKRRDVTEKITEDGFVSRPSRVTKPASGVTVLSPHISRRIAQRSGKIGLNSDSFRNGTPGEPPVPFFAPIVRSTSLMCR